MTHTYSILEVSPKAFAEVKLALESEHKEKIHKNDEFGEVIDMQGLALATACHEKEPEKLVNIPDILNDVMDNISTYRFYEAGLDRKQSTTAQTVARKIIEEMLNDHLNKNR